MSTGIAGKVVIVTGASSGIGEAAARHLAAAGAKLVLGARSAERMQILVKEISAAGGSARALATDVARYSDVQALVQDAVTAYGRLDVIINNAGIMPLSLLERAKVEDWDRMIDVNIKGVLYGIAAALPLMRAQKSGHIITVSSVAGHKVRQGSSVYAATKHAVRVISEGLRMEVKPYGIRTTIISPGAVATELPDSVTEPDVQDRVRALYKLAIPAESIAQAIAYVIAQPAEVDVNELLIRPTEQEF